MAPFPDTMPFINTDEGAFLNSDYIVWLKRDTHTLDRPRGAGQSESYWNLTVTLVDGSTHKVTGSRAAEAVRVLMLPKLSIYEDEMANAAVGGSEQ